MIPRRVWLPALTFAVAAAVSQTEGTTYLAVDVPTLLSGVPYEPNDIVRREVTGYALERSLPAGLQLSALERSFTGGWMFTPAHRVTLSGVDYEPRDVVLWDGTSFAKVMDGSDVGIPEYAKIDALLSVSGALVLSLDVPVALAGSAYDRSDLVKFDGALFSLFWSGSSAGVPLTSNVVGAGLSETGKLVVSFDIPTTIGGNRWLPGQLVQWDAAGFLSYSTDPAWPASAQLRDFAIVPAQTISGGVGNSRKLVYALP